jgi:hypothetical protein
MSLSNIWFRSWYVLVWYSSEVSVGTLMNDPKYVLIYCQQKAMFLIFLPPINEIIAKSVKPGF